MKDAVKLLSKNRYNILFFFVTVTPIVDLTTSLNERLHFLSFSPGAILKVVLLSSCVIVVLNRAFCSKKRAKYVLCLSLIVIACILHLLFSGATETQESFLFDVRTILKYCSLPIFLLALSTMRGNNPQGIKKIFIAITISALVYSFFIITPTIFNVNYPAYGYTKVGSTGWYYAANELGPIMIMHFFAVLQIMKKSQKKMPYVVLLSLCSISIAMIETKTAIFSLVIISVIDFVVSVLNLDKKSCLSLATVLIIGLSAPLMMRVFEKTTPLPIEPQKNVALAVAVPGESGAAMVSNSVAHEYDEVASAASTVEGADRAGGLTKKVFYKLDILMSHRLSTTQEIYAENQLNLTHLLFGKTRITLSEKNATAEIDYVDILLRLGLVGLLIYALIIVNSVKKILHGVPRNPAFWEYALFVMLIVALSAAAGHILTSPSVCFYLSLTALPLLSRNSPDKTKIPKTIHYVWVGGAKKSKLIKRCMKTWKAHLSDYKIIEWNENNFKIKQHPFLEAAYKAKKWAFVSDYIRAFVIFHEGGIYLDTDVLVLDNFDAFLDNDAFVGFENKSHPFTAAFGATKGHPLVKRMLDYYDNLEKYDFNFDNNNTISVSNILISEYGCRKNNKFQILKNDIAVYPDGVLCNPSKDSVAIHIFTGTWLNEKKAFKNRIITFIKSNIRTRLAAALYRKFLSRNKS